MSIKIHWQWRRCKRCGFDPGLGRSPGEGQWQPTPGFLPGESHGQKSLVGYSPWDRKESDMTKETEHNKLIYTDITGDTGGLPNCTDK